MMPDDGVLTEDQVRDWISAERLARLKAGGWLSPGYRFEGFEGVPAYQADYVRLRYQEDKRSHPEEGRRPPVVTKGYGRPAPPPAGGYGEFWTEAAAEVLLGRQAFTKALRSRSLRPAAVRAGVQLFRREDVRRHLPRVLSPAVQREYLALRRAMRAAGLGA
jgi:hypothetical protein